MFCKKQRIIAFFLALLLCVTNITSTEYVYAADNEIQTSTLTFNVYGEGYVQVTTATGEEQIITDGSTSLTLPEQSYVRLHVYSEGTDSEGITINISTEKGIQIEEPSRFYEDYLTRDITVTQIDKTIDIALGSVLQDTNMFANTGTSSAPEEGDEYTGTCTVDTVTSSQTGMAVDTVKMEIDTGILKAEETVTVYCADHGAAAPYVGQEFNYTYTITDVNKSSGKVEGYFYASAKSGSATDSSMLLPSGKGYQRVGGTVETTGEYDGYLKLKKTSSDTSVTSGNNNYSLVGAKYGVYTNKSCTNKVGTLTTVSGGNSNTLTLSPGKYYVKETDAPKGYELNDTVHTVDIESDETKTLNVSDTPIQGKIKIRKISADTSVTNNNNNFSLEDAKFGIYTDKTCNNRIKLLKTDEDGETSSFTVPLGTYYIKETTAPKGYELNETVFTVNVTEDKTYTVTVSDEPQKGYVYLTKESAEEDVTDDNDNYSLAGAKYGVYTNKACTKKVGTLTTTSSGKTNTLTLDAGTYYVKETTAPDGYLLDDTVHTIVIKPGETKTLEVNDTPIQGKVKIKKSSSNTSVTDDNSNYSLTNAKYGIYSNKKCTKKVGTLTTNAKGVSETLTLPLGTYYVKEIDAPKGYEVNDTVYTVNITSNITLTVNVSDTPIQGKIKVVKKSANTEITNNNNNFSLKSAIFGVYTDAACENWYANLETNESGNSSTITLPLGKYYIKEVAAPQGYEKNDTVFTVNVTENKTYTVTVEDEPLDGKVYLLKESSDTSVTANNNNYSLSGAVYNVYSEMKCVTKVGTLTTTSTGKSNTLTLDVGTYYIKEVTAPKGYEKDNTVYTITLKPGVTSKLEVKDTPIQGYLKIVKSSSLPEITTDNDCYSLEGAKFEVYSDRAKTKLVGTLITNEKGETNTLTLPLGVYYITEKVAPKGFALASDTSVTITEGLTTKEIIDVPQNDPVYILLKKYDAETGKGISLGGATLEGAEYTVKYYDGYYSTAASLKKVTAERTWVVSTDETGFAMLLEKYIVSGDELYYMANGIPTLPLGTITIQETKAPEGYLINNNLYIRQITSDGMTESVYTYNAPSIPETVKRGDLEFTKIDEKTSQPMANVTFKLTHLTTGESHLLVTDENGYVNTASSWNKHSSNTNRGRLSSDGIWFGMDQNGDMVDVDDSVGALPYGEYLLEEVRNENTIGYDLFEPIKFTIDADNQTYSLGNITNSPVSLSTKALDKDTATKLSVNDGKIEIVDSVYYDGLAEGKTYELVGTVYDTATNLPLEINGKKIIVEKTFTPSSSKGKVNVKFTLESDELAGKTFVITEVLYRNNILIQSHEDLTDENQMIQVPSLKTYASNYSTNNKLIAAEKNVQVKDVVTYSNLIQNEYYTIKGKLINSNTGKILVIDGKEVTCEKTFKARKKAGSETLIFDFNAEKCAGDTFTVYEQLFDSEGNLVASHEVLKDDDQTVYFPKVTTTALDSVLKDHLSSGKGQAIIEDTVKYENLLPGKNYTIKGMLMDKSTGNPLVIDGEEVTVEKTFIATNNSGTVQLDFVFDASEVTGTTVVVYENLYIGESLIASHSDLSDEKQTVYIPLIGTTAVEGTLNEHIAIPKTNSIISDKISYKDLLPGRNYKVSGILINKETGKPLLINGKEITVEKMFMPTTTNGSVEVVFEFDASHLAGTTIVVFEKLYLNGIEIAYHEDLEDENQTIYYPQISTSAVEDSCKDHVATPKENSIIYDTVTYTNLLPGKEYKIKGVLMNKETEESLLINGEMITAEKTFTAAATNGSIILGFEVDASQLAGTTVVVYEKLYYGETEIVSHENINDEAQTIYYPEISTTASEHSYNNCVAIADDDSVITDEVSYKNLLPGKEYKIKGVLMNKETGEPLLINGEMITAEKTFTAATEHGSSEIIFTLDASKLAGTTVVVYEKLYYGEIEIVSHENINDEAQTIYYPNINTVAIDEQTQKHISVTNIETKIIDIVTYENLAIGEEYVCEGILMNKETGEPLIINGETVTASKTFITTKSNDYISLEFEFDSSALKGTTIVVYETLMYQNKELIAHKDLSDTEQSIYFPMILTNAMEEELKEHIAISRSDTKITDVVNYKHLCVGEEYTIKGILMVRETGEPLLVNDNFVTSETTFVPTKEEGAVELQFEFDATELNGTTIVVFETLMLEGIEITSHKDITDETQTIYFPNISTNAAENQFNDHISSPNQDLIITDTVSYTNLLPGKKYTITGILMDKETNTALMVDQQTVTSTVTFVAEQAEGQIKLEFILNAAALKGTTLVVFEKLYYKDIEITSHEDISDEKQTIYIPEIQTNAIEKSFNDHVGIPNVKTSIVDTVTYTNLLPGKEYTVTGVLMDRETGNPLLVNGQEVTAGKTFVATTTEGTIDIEFTLDTSSFVGKTVVVYEKLYFMNVEIASHEDINDENQAIYYPEISTSATENSSDDHIGIVGETTVITDTIQYNNLLPGKEYTVKGTLIDKKTEAPLLVNDEEITVTKTFTPEAADGSVEIIFPLDTKGLTGTTVVVFEKLYYKNAEIISHENINDEEQTIYFPKISTEANVNTTCYGHISSSDEMITITDTVTYTDLLIGQEYTISGTLMDKDTKEPLLINDNLVTSQLTFIPEEANGSVEIEFNLNADTLAGTTIVAYEKLFYKDVEITSHEDIDDDAQTVYIPGITTNASEKNTGLTTATVKETNVIVDTVIYTDLLPGVEYTVKGIIYDKETNKPLEFNDAYFESEISFVPDTPNGEVKLEFSVLGEAAGGKVLVVFEELYCDNALVAAHKDINDKNQTVKFEYTDILISKVNKVTGNLLEGAKLQLYEVIYEDSEYKELLIDEWISSNDKHSYGPLKPGSYIIREAEAPAGYVTCEDIAFTKIVPYETLEFVIEDDITKVQFNKIDSEDGSNIVGARMKITNADGEIVAKWTTTEENYYIEYLPVGHYKLEEEKAPYGYLLSDAVDFIIENTGDVQIVEMQDARPKGYIEIEKLSSVNRKVLEGAEFVIKDLEGNELQTLVTGKDGTVKSQLFDIGNYNNGKWYGKVTYVLQETKAPEGYELDTREYLFEFDYLGSDVPVVYINYKIPNEKIEEEIPEPIWQLVPTGDDSMLGYYGTSFALTGTWILYIMFKKKKNQL